MIIRRRIFKPTNVIPPFDPTDDFSTNDTVKWGGTAPSGGLVAMGSKYSKFKADTASNFQFTFDVLNIGNNFGGVNGQSPIIVELLGSENGVLVGTHASGIMSDNGGGGAMYAWSNTPNEQLPTSADLDVNFSCNVVCLWNSGTNVFSVTYSPSTGGSYNVQTTAFAPPNPVWLRIRNQSSFFMTSQLDQFTGDSGVYFL